MHSTAPAANRFLSPRKFFLLGIAGVIGEIVLEIAAWIIAPLVLGRPMQPALLVADLARSLFGTTLPMSAAFIIHLASGIVVFPIGYLLLRSWTKIKSPTVAGILWGVVLWLVAQAVLAPLAGRPFMLNFTPYTWASLAAHIVYTLAVALSYEWLLFRATFAKEGAPR
jgi:hypothetical protein